MKGQNQRIIKDIGAEWKQAYDGEHRKKIVLVARA